MNTRISILKRKRRSVVKARKFWKLIYIFILMIAIMATLATQAMASNSYKSGNWNDPTTWEDNIVPDGSSDVLIIIGHNITVTEDTTVNSITFAQGSSISTTKLTVNAGLTLTIANNIIIQNAGSTTIGVTFEGEGTISCAGVEVGGSNIPESGEFETYFHSNISNLNIANNIRITGMVNSTALNHGAFYLESGTLSVGGTIELIGRDPDTAYAEFNNAWGVRKGTLILSGADPFTISGYHKVRLDGDDTTVIYSGDTQNILSPPYNTAYPSYQNLTISNSGTKSLNADIRIGGNLTVNNGATLDLNSYYPKQYMSQHTFTLGSGCNLLVGGSINFPRGFGSYILDPTSTVNYNANIDQTVATPTMPGSSFPGLIYGNLVLSGSNAKIIYTNDITVVGNLSID